jgi:ketosteroid isomerase-like protein
MKRLVTFVCVMTMLLPLQAAGLAAGENGSRAERENLAIAVAWDEAFNSEDIDAVMALYADGAVEAPPGFPPLVGKDAIRADYEFLFENFDFHHQTTVVQLEIQGTMAVERGAYTMIVVPADGSPAYVETGKHMIVRRETNGVWRSVMETWNVD